MSATTEQVSDGELVAAARTGEKTAFGELVRRHQGSAVRVAAVALGSSDDAEDVAQEAFVKAHRSLHHFRDDGAFRPWLLQIVVNTAKNRQRRFSRQRNLALRVGARPEIAEPGPDEVAAHRADQAIVIGAINRLRPADRLILTYRWYEQLSEAEIAQALGCRPGTVKSRLNRAMNRLRQELGVAGPTPSTTRSEP